MLSKFLLLLPVTGLVSAAVQCNQDNCYRAFSNRLPTASAFCATYTTTTNTATTALPTYATQCSDLPSRISSACSCLFTPKVSTTSTSTSSTRTTSSTSTVPTSSSKSSTTLSTSTTSSTTSTTPTVAATCIPSKLQNIQLNLNANYQAPPWTYSVYQDPAQTSLLDVQYAPESSFGFTALEVSYYGGKDPVLSTTTLTQGLASICPGTYTLSFEFLGLNDAQAPSPFTSQNCTVTYGLYLLSSSTSYTAVPMGTSFESASNTFTVSGIPSGGISGDVYFTIGCTMAEYYPTVLLGDPNLTFVAS